MKGKPVTLANIQAAINNKFPQSSPDKDEGKIVKILLFPFKLIGRSLPYLSPAFGNFLLPAEVGSFRIFCLRTLNCLAVVGYLPADRGG